jgi:hypothetical protein
VKESGEQKIEMERDIEGQRMYLSEDERGIFLGHEGLA